MDGYLHAEAGLIMARPWIEFVRGGGGYRSALFIRWRYPWLLIMFVGGWPTVVWLRGGLCDLMARPSRAR